MDESSFNFLCDKLLLRWKLGHRVNETTQLQNLKLEETLEII